MTVAKAPKKDYRAPAECELCDHKWKAHFRNEAEFDAVTCPRCGCEKVWITLLGKDFSREDFAYLGLPALDPLSDPSLN